jgi:hypothetical protein
MDINMAKLGLDPISVALHKAYSLGIVAPKSLLCLKREVNVTTEAMSRFESLLPHVQACLTFGEMRLLILH